MATVSLLYLSFLLFSFCSHANCLLLSQHFDFTWSSSRSMFLEDGNALQLSLDNSSGSAFASKEKYMFGDIEMQIKLIPGDSAGTVTAYYLSSLTSNHDEFDFEFLGNISGQPYILQTNLYASGIGGREQRIYLWFDPTTDYHSYSISWDNQHVIFLVDKVPIRSFGNNEAKGEAYPNQQPMGVYGSLWNGDSWATEGGLIKVNWTHSPFITSFRGFKANACVVPSSSGDPSICKGSSSPINSHEPSAALDASVVQKLEWVKNNYMVYNYCSDTKRYAQPPPECTNY